VLWCADGKIRQAPKHPALKHLSTLMSASNDERQLWRHGSYSCVMVSCCAGAELQVRQTVPERNDEEILLRELYPTKSTTVRTCHELAADIQEPRTWNRGPRTRNLEPGTQNRPGAGRP